MIGVAVHPELARHRGHGHLAQTQLAEVPRVGGGDEGDDAPEEESGEGDPAAPERAVETDDAPAAVAAPPEP